MPDPFIFGSAADLGCRFAWDTKRNGDERNLYSIKWFKDNEEFYR